MKKILSALLCSVVALTAFAQAPKIEKSEPVDVPVDVYSKLLLLKNGNTFFLRFTYKEGLQVTVFNAQRKIIADKEITSDLWNPKMMRRSNVAAFTEIHGEPVLFLEQFEKFRPMLYRIRFDPQRGTVLKEEEIGGFPKFNYFDLAADVRENGTGLNYSKVIKDDRSDCYAVFYDLGNSGDIDARIKVVHYNGMHKIISSAVYASPEGKFRRLKVAGAAVDSDRRVFVTAYGAADADGEDGYVYVARLNAGDTVFANKRLDFSEGFKKTTAIMRYNNSNNNLYMMTKTYVKTKSKVFSYESKTVYLCIFSVIDPESLQIKSVNPIGNQKIDEYAKRTFNLENEFVGLPQQFVINKDNTMAILSEEQTTISQSKGPSYSLLGNIGISELNEDGTEKNGMLILKNQNANPFPPSNYIYERSKGTNQGYVGISSSFDYIYTDKHRYVIFNDIPSNFEREKVDSGGDAAPGKRRNAVCYSFADNKITKAYLFGEPEEKKQAKYLDLEYSSYQPATNTYASLFVDEDRKNSEQRVVWLTFQ